MHRLDLVLQWHTSPTTNTEKKKRNELFTSYRNQREYLNLHEKLILLRRIDIPSTDYKEEHHQTKQERTETPCKEPTIQKLGAEQTDYRTREFVSPDGCDYKATPPATSE